MKESTIVNDTLEYIENHLNENLSLDEIEKELNYSKFYINRLFSQKVGCTIYKYIRARRLTEAARQLAETEKPIIDIAFEAHYDSQQAFTLAFQQLYHCPPRIYRKNKNFYPKQAKMTVGCSLVCPSYFIISLGKVAA